MRIRLDISSEEKAKEGSAEAMAVANIFIVAFDLYLRKRYAYGRAWKEQGYMGQTARILSKASRLKNMLWQAMPTEDTEESINDTVIDMMNLCVFFLLNRGQDNPWGRGPYDA